MKYENVESVEFDSHRWYTVVILKFKDGTTLTPTIGTAWPGEGPGLFDSVDDFITTAEGM